MTLPSARMLKVQKTKAKADRARRSCEGSLATFIRHAWKIVEHDREYVQNWHIDVLCEHLEAVSRRQIRNLIINLPPRHMKSLSVAVFWPAWTWTWKPSECWLYGSYSPKLSTRDSVKCRRILDSPWYLKNWGSKYFGDNKQESILRPDQNEKMRYENLCSGIRISTSVGGTGTGDGGDIIIVDDPHKVKGVESSVLRHSVIDWWDNEMSTRGNDPLTVCKLVIMQRVHDEDLTGHLLEKAEENWDHLCLPFEHEPKTTVDMKRTTSIGVRDPREKEGELLWKNRYDKKAVSDLKTSLTVYQQTGQLQQRPTPKEGTIFKREWFEKRWSTLPDRFDHMLTCWDLTFGESETSAFNVGYCLGLKRPNILILDEVRMKMDITKQLKYIPAFRDKNEDSREILIENAANAKAVVGLLKSKIPGVFLVNPIGSKEDRAEAVTWLFQGGNILFPEDAHAPWVNPAIEEIVSFGPKAKYKDRVDSMVHGVERLSKRMKNMGVAPSSHEKLAGWTIR